MKRRNTKIYNEVFGEDKVINGFNDRHISRWENKRNGKLNIIRQKNNKQDFFVWFLDLGVGKNMPNAIFILKITTDTVWRVSLR